MSNSDIKSSNNNIGYSPISSYITWSSDNFDAESSKLLLPYKELIEKYGQKITKDYQSDSGFSMSIEGPVYNEPMQKAGENLFEDIKSQGLCKSVNR